VGAEGGGGAVVGFGAEGAVDAEGGDSPTAVAKPAGDGAEVDAGGDELRGRVVAELLDVEVVAEPCAHPVVALADGVR
jgi:hypothetical protein